MQEIFINLTYKNQAPVFSEHIHWFPVGLVWTGFPLITYYLQWYYLFLPVPYT